jgi:ATP/maltotriose-dependent transcriptional regulator MalT
VKSKVHPDRVAPKAGIAAADGVLEKARESYRRRDWHEAWRALSVADRQAPLAGADLELLAMAAYLLGRDDDYLDALDRAHGVHLSAGETLRAARCAFWLGFRLLMRAETGRSTGWLSRAQRLLERQAGDCAERGYVLLPLVEQQLEAADYEVAYATAASAAEIGERCADADLVACARHQQGRVRLQQGHLERGLALLDEVMVSVTAGELSPLVTGLMYCSVIQACQAVYAFGRAREWTAALAQWCDQQPEMVAFTGVCRVHRAEIMQLRGAWQSAIEETHRARECSRGFDRRATAAALYQEAEVHRLRGEVAAAEDAYRRASECGFDPQPGLALLSASLGRADAAAKAIEVALGTTAERLSRSKLLPAAVEIMLAAGDVDAARRACEELEDIARSMDSRELDAIAACARASLELAQGDAQVALVSSRRAARVWQRAEAPYLLAQARALAGLACRALGDAEGARLELDAARLEFERLGAAPDLARLDTLSDAAVASRRQGLTAREIQVLRLVAAGKTNKAIAAELFLSEKTIDRHVSNIFIKLDVASRAAATARAYEHKLIQHS